MKQTHKIFIFSFFIYSLTYNSSFAQNVGISITGTLPNASAMLDLNTGSNYTSPNGKGLLIPNVFLANTTDAVTIGAPATSLLVYNTNAALANGKGFYYNVGTSVSPSWVRFMSGTPSTDWKLTGNAGTTAGTNFLGTTDAQDLVFKTNGVENMRVSSNGNVGIGTTVPSVRLHVVGSDFGVVGRIENLNSTASRFPGLQILNFAGSTAGHPFLWLGNSRGSNTTPLPVIAGDNLGAIIFSGRDGTSFNQSARVEAFATNTFSVTKQLSDITFVFDTINNGFTTPNEVMRIKSSGKVGIMNASPNATLTIGTAMAGTALGRTFITNAGALGASSGNSLTLANIGFTSANFQSLGIRAHRTAAGNNWLTTAISIGIDVDNLQNAGASLVFNSNGNIGVGTISPTQKLHLFGGAVYIQNTNGFQSIIASSDGGIELYRSASGATPNANGFIDFKKTESNDHDFRITWDGALGTNGGLEFISTTDGSVGTALSRMVILNSNGFVGIGTAAPTQKLTVFNGTTTGTYTTTGWIHTSDARFKTNVTTIKKALQKIKQLRGVNFNWKHTTKTNPQIGFIAQEVEKVLPQVVVKDVNGKYGMSYGNLTAVLVEAIKEQQQIIESLKVENTAVLNEVKNLKSSNQQQKQEIENRLKLIEEYLKTASK